MTQEEFKAILEENTYFPNIKENAMYRFPAINFYIQHLDLSINGVRIKDFIGHIIEPKTEEEYRLICYAFLLLRQRFGFEK
jgi:hypothetical protein